MMPSALERSTDSVGGTSQSMTPSECCTKKPTQPRYLPRSLGRYVGRRFRGRRQDAQQLCLPPSFSARPRHTCGRQRRRIAVLHGKTATPPCSQDLLSP